VHFGPIVPILQTSVWGDFKLGVVDQPEISLAKDLAKVECEGYPVSTIHS
jgi:hypothetical protein